MVFLLNISFQNIKKNNHSFYLSKDLHVVYKVLPNFIQNPFIF